MSRKLSVLILFSAFTLGLSSEATEQIHCVGYDGKGGTYYEIAVEVDDRFKNLSLNVEIAKAGEVPEGGGPERYTLETAQKFFLRQLENDDAHLIARAEVMVGKNKENYLLKIPNENFGAGPKTGAAVSATFQIPKNKPVAVSCFVRPALMMR